jgi:hypothetical protein
MKGHICEKPPGSGNWYAVIEMRYAANVEIAVAPPR